jgi:hypothetical protein
MSMTELPPNPKQAYGDLKIPVALVPPAAIIYTGLAFKEGARKYGPYNWREKSVEAMTYVNAAQRHLMSWADGEEIDPDSGNPHLAHALACLAILVDCIETGNLLDNRPPAGNAGALLKRFEKKPAEKSPDQQALAEALGDLRWVPEVARREPRPLPGKYEHALPDLDQEFPPCVCGPDTKCTGVHFVTDLRTGERRQCVVQRAKDDKRFDWDVQRAKDDKRFDWDVVSAEQKHR